MRDGSGVQILQQEFKRRLEKNPSYSLRAFAQALEISPGRLSEIFSGKRNISKKMAVRLADRLSLDLATRHRFFAGLLESSASASSSPMTKSLAEEEFALISDWQHFAILSLLETKGFKSDMRWIAQRLGITVIEVREAVGRLERLELVKWSYGKSTKSKENSKSSGLGATHEKALVLNQKGAATSTDVPSGAIRRYHKYHILHAAESLETVPVEKRDITSITMAIDVEKLPEAKRLIRNFRKQMSRLLETGQRSEVYNLNLQLVPLTTTGNE